MTRTVAFVGPLPPPLHGFSEVNANMLRLLREHATVAVVDRAQRNKGIAFRLIQQLRDSTRYLRTLLSGADARLYLPLSGGMGQIIDGYYVSLARILRRPIAVHHHSFAYINHSTVINRAMFFLLRRATHIVLSQGMGDRLAARYRLDPKSIKVVSNAVFCGPRSAITRSTPCPEDAPIRIGFISNIVADKGFVEFFEVLKELSQSGVPYRGYIAGPVSEAARGTFDRLLGAARDVEYVGPVYNDAKQKFYQHLDVLLFATKYANEAEPLVINEALRNGVYAMSCIRGAIPEMLANGAGEVFEHQRFVPCAVAAIGRLSADRSQLARAQQLALEQAERLHRQAESELSGVIRLLTQ